MKISTVSRIDKTGAINERVTRIDDYDIYGKNFDEINWNSKKKQTEKGEKRNEQKEQIIKTCEELQAITTKILKQ